MAQRCKGGSRETVSAMLDVETTIAAHAVTVPTVAALVVEDAAVDESRHQV